MALASIKTPNALVLSEQPFHVGINNLTDVNLWVHKNEGNSSSFISRQDDQERPQVQG